MADGVLERQHQENLSAIERELDSRSASNYTVSALVSLYNADDYLEGLIEDLTQQTLYARGELEIIIVDSSSPGNEWPKLECFAEQHEHIRAIRTRDRESLYMAWNRAAGEARGRYFTNANADDRHRRDALERLAGELDSDSGIGVVYGDARISRVANQRFEDVPADEPFQTPDFFAPALLLYYGLGPQSIWRREVHEAAGLFDGSFRAAGDWEFAIRMAQAVRGRRVPEVLGSFYVGSSNISFADDTMAKEDQRVRQQHWRPEVVDKLYQREGIAVATREEKACTRLDLALRALEFVNPLGGRRRVLPLALQLLQEASGLDPKLAEAVVAAGAAMALSGQADQAKQLWGQVAEVPHLKEIVEHNLSVLPKLNVMEPFAGLRLPPSGLNLPGQRDLSAGRSRQRSKVEEPINATMIPHSSVIG